MLSLNLSWLNLTAINDGPQYDTPPGNLCGLSTPLTKVIDLRDRADPVSLLFFNDTELLSSEDMAKVYRLYVGLATALALYKYSLAEWNATAESANRTVSHCHHHGNRDNCTADTIDTGEWNGHFSKCPEELEYYCVHGECRYIKEQKTPSCRCLKGYLGSRCEYVDLGLQIGDKRQIIIFCVIGGLVVLILLVVLICICSHRRYRLCRRRGRRREEPRNGTEKLSMMDTSTALQPTEPPRTDDV